MSWAAIAIGVGSVAAGAISASASSSAGKKAQGAAGAAAKQYAAAGKQGSKLIGDASESAIGRLEPYREKLGNLKQLLVDMFEANQAVTPAAFRQARLTNTFNQNELNRLLEGVLPGYREGAQQAQNNNLSMLRGEIPADVSALVRRNAAQRSLQGGFGGSESSRALESRDLGLTSLNLMEQGSNSQQRWIQTARTYMTPGLADPLQSLATPGMALQSTLAAAGIAGQQANIETDSARFMAQLLTGQANMATGAQLQGAEANIAGQRQAAESWAKGIEGAAGAYAGYRYMQQPTAQPAAGGYGSFADATGRSQSIYGGSPYQAGAWRKSAMGGV